jgi:hypothetical protein
VLYAVVARVAGVIVDVLWSNVWAFLGYAVLSLGVLGALLCFYGQPPIAGMRWLLKRTDRVPPWPFNRSWGQ